MRRLLPRSVRRALCAALMSLLFVRALALPFTYQGRLVDGTALANGNYELTFRLFDSLTVGNRVGPELVLTPVEVTNGLFTVALDFGNAAFDGTARWLEMAARPSGTGVALSVFAPRQAITAVPYALHALSGSGDAGALTTGTLADGRLSGNVARTSDVLSVSNSLSDRLVATNDVLAGLIGTLNTRVTDVGVSATTVSNVLSTRLVGTNDALVSLILALSSRVIALEASSGSASGSLLASALPADPVLLAQGLTRAGGIPAPAWVRGSGVDAPSAREGHSAIWTGQEMWVWGGSLGGAQYSLSGGAYQPDTDGWTILSPLDAPTARSGHTAVWTGTEMIVWGGFSGSAAVDTGARHGAATQSWRPVSSVNAPTARDSHLSVWTGSAMLVWGGRNRSTLAAAGAQYRPGTDAWEGLPVANEPVPRMSAAGVWAGDRWLVWGGMSTSGYDQSGGQLLCLGGTPTAWQAMSTVGAPSGREGHAAVWTGTRLLVWGGHHFGTPLNDGAAYDPITDLWTPISAVGAPSARSLPAGAWTGSEWVLVGGLTASGAASGGAAYTPATDTWRTLDNPGSPVARSGAASVWTGSEMILFGGRNATTLQGSLERLTPQSAWYFYRKP
ncbi:MAG: hypothetical protein RIS76_788 [Verrucomicrobiota bacterium]